jgi:predicted unusual protein kinase regulating ubiquinone biosynthesis (AarF/ABC1/UbiB family)
VAGVAVAVAGAALVVGAGLLARAGSRRGAGTAATGSALGGLGRRGRRTATLARMGARHSTDWAVTRARSAVAGEQRAAELQAAFELRTAEQVAETLGHMKGALMKIGQMASYLDQSLPEPVREALAQLQSDAPPMSAELVAEVVAAELGGPPEAVFAEWDPTPLASASIGQVHRARTTDGRDVAVKVQYPGVDDAIRSDLANTDLLFSMLSVLFPGMDPAPIVGELRERVTEELDYRAEAGHQRLFAQAYRGHPYIHVPEVLDDLSTARVLTTELAEGARFAEVLDWPDDERQLAAETIYRFAFGSIYNLAAFNGDPHPGNYLFRPGGQVTFLDFGLCKRFSEDEVAVFEEMITRIVLERDVAGFRRVIEGVGILPRSVEATDEEVFEYFGHFYEFVLEDGVVEMTPEWSSESLRRFFDLGGPHGDLMKQANLPPSMVIIQRINLGLFALFGDLRARNHWRRISEEIWPWVDAPPATPMGERIAAWAEASGAGG